MNSSTKFTQTKFKQRATPPVTPITKKARKRCPVPPPNTATSEARTSKEFSPPPPSTIMKSFLLDIAQEVVTAKPIDMIDHLGGYSDNLQKVLRERRAKLDEEDAIRALMEAKAKQLEIEDRASRVLQMAFRGLKMKKLKQISEIQLNEYIVDGATLEDANKAATCIQRNFRKHTIKKRTKKRLAQDMASERSSTSSRANKRKEDISIIKTMRHGDEYLEEKDTVEELYGPSKPYNPEGESFGVEDPCPMASPLLAKIPQSIMSDLDFCIEVDETGEATKVKRVHAGSVCSSNSDDSIVTPEVNNTNHQEEKIPARSSGTRKNEENDDMTPPPLATERSSGPLRKVSFGDEIPNVEDHVQRSPQPNGELNKVEQNPSSNSLTEEKVEKELLSTDVIESENNEA